MQLMSVSRLSDSIHRAEAVCCRQRYLHGVKRAQPFHHAGIRPAYGSVRDRTVWFEPFDECACSTLGFPSVTLLSFRAASAAAACAMISHS